jgi:hypothetical protein
MTIDDDAFVHRIQGLGVWVFKREVGGELRRAQNRKPFPIPHPFQGVLAQTQKGPISWDIE